jgi:hypothetical protein
MPLNLLTFQKIFNDPEFAKLDYATQQNIKKTLLQKQLSDDQPFLALTPEGQGQVLQALNKKIVEAPPVFENPAFGETASNPNLVNSFFNPLFSSMMTFRGSIWAADKVNKAMQSVGIAPKMNTGIWEMYYSPDSVKLTQYAAEKAGTPNLPQVAAIAGNITDWIIGAKLPTGVGLGIKSVGTGISHIAAGAAERAAAGNATSAIGKAVGTWVATGKLTTSGAASTFSNTVLTTGMRDFIVSKLAGQVAKSTGVGLMGVGRELVQNATTDLPWDPGIEANFKEVAKVFGSYAALDYGFNTAINSIAPFVKVVGKGVFGRSLETGGLKELATLQPDEMSELIRKLKLGIMDDVVFTRQSPGVQDHLTALAEFSKIGDGGLSSIAHDPVLMVKSLGFLTNHDVVDSVVPGTFRIRTGPGAALKQMIGGDMRAVAGSTVLTDGVRLPEVQRIITERFGESRLKVSKNIERLSKELEDAQKKLKEIEGNPEFAGELLVQEQKVNSINSKLQGQIISAKAYESYDQFFTPMLESIETAKATYQVQGHPDMLPGSKRTAITYEEAQRVMNVPGAKSIRFTVGIPKHGFSGKEATLRTVEGKVFAVKDLKDFFIKNSDTFVVKPAEGDYNAIFTYSRPVNQKIYEDTMRVAKNYAKSFSTSSAEDLAQGQLLTAGFDAVEMADGSVLSLLPRSQIKHVSDLIDPFKGTYKAGVDVGRTAVKPSPEGKLSNAFLSDLGKDTHIRFSFKIPIDDKSISGNSEAIITLMKGIYGDVKSDVVKKVSKIFFDQYGIDSSSLRVVRLSDITAKDIIFEKSAHGYVLKVPTTVKNPREQFEFIKNMGDALAKELRENEVKPFIHKYNKNLSDFLSAEYGYNPKTMRVKDYSNPTTYGAELRKLNREGKKIISLAREQALEDIPGFSKEAQRVKKKNIFTSPVPGATEAEKAAWLADSMAVVKNTEYIVGNDGMKTLKFTNGDVFSSNILDDLIDEFLLHNTSEAQVRFELKDNLNLELTKSTKEGVFYEVWDQRGKKPLYLATSIPDLLKQMNFRPDRIDSVFAPKVVAVGASDVTFQMRGPILQASISQARKILDKFWDYGTASSKSVIKKTELGRISKHIDTHIEVEIPEWGIRKHFYGDDAIAEASSYLNGRFSETEEIKKLAEQRGMIFRDRGGEYVLYDETGTFHAKTKEEVGKILARSPDPSFLPDILPEFPEDKVIAAQLQHDVSSYGPGVWALPEERLPVDLGLTEVSGSIRPLHDWLITYARKTTDTKLVELYQKAETGNREATRQINEVRRVINYYLSDQHPSKINGKPIFVAYPEEQLKGMKEWMEATNPSDKAKIFENYHLEEKHVKSAIALRDLLGTDPITNPGLFGKLGIDTNKFLFEYLPIIRARVMEKGGAALKGLSDGDLTVFLERVFKDSPAGIPKELRFFAENERLSNLVEFAREDNLAKLILRYNDQGTKKFFLNEVWKELELYKKHAPNITEAAIHKMDRYQEIIMGKFTDKFEKRVAAFGRHLTIKANSFGNKFRTLLGKEEVALSPTAGEHLMDMIFTTNTFTTQAYRVWLTVRNMSQIYTTAAPILGNRWVDAATKELSSGTAMEDLIDVLRARATITEAAPVLGGLSHGEGKLSNAIGSATEKGMRGMKRSDDITRAIAYKAAEMKWDYFMKMALGGKRGNPLEAIGVNLAHDEISAEIVSLLSKKDSRSISTARHLFADDMTRLTMFDYTKQNMAGVGQGFLGKLFGQYQVYPVYYISMLKHIMTHGTAAQKFSTMARIAVNGAAIYGALQAIGLEGKNMLPWVPASLTGGPMWNVMLALSAGTDTTGYKGKAARGELMGTLKRLIPGSYEWRMVSGAIKYLDQGKPLLALYALTSAPIRSDLR